MAVSSRCRTTVGRSVASAARLPSLPDMPIGGVKDSGYGYEGGRAGIEAFLHFKLVSTTY